MLGYGKEEGGAWQGGWLSEGKRWEMAVFTGGILVPDLLCFELRENKICEGRWG